MAERIVEYRSEEFYALIRDHWTVVHLAVDFGRFEADRVDPRLAVMSPPPSEPGK